MPTASIPNAMNIVFFRPRWSETQPKNGRVRPLSTRSIESANATIGKPLERVADAGPVDRARADAADRGREVQQEQRIGDRVDDPGDADQHAADEHHRTRPEAVDEVAFDRDQPGLGDDEDRE